MYYLKEFLVFIKHIFLSRRLLVILTHHDIRARYLGSFLGFLWAFIQPAIMIFILWFVFQVGFKSRPMANIPFVLWLIAGIIPWFFFSDVVVSTTNSIIENSFLVKKVVFRVSILPIIKVLSGLMIHLFFIGILIIILLLYGVKPSIFWLQSLYYLSGMVMLTVGIGWLMSSLAVFVRDISHFVGVAIQFGFWITPIFWPISMVPEKYNWLIKLNPVFYVVEGYRDSFFRNIPFWTHRELTILFWLETGIIFILGAMVFKRLRPHFADVL